MVEEEYKMEVSTSGVQRKLNFECLQFFGSYFALHIE